jgi:hypothetical protein
MDVLGQLQKLAAPEVFAEMSHPDISGYRCVFFKIGIIKSPIVGEVRTDKHYVAGIKLFDAIADELCSLTFFKMDQLYFGVIMPAVINIRDKILPYTKGMLGFF